MGKQKFDFFFTKLPNEFLDHDMKIVGGSETKMFLFIVRKTIGWGKRTDMISYSQFKEFTGYSIPTIRKALENLQLEGLINQYPEGKSYRYGITDKYLQKKVKQHSDNSLKKLHLNGKESFIESPKKFTPQKINKNTWINTTKNSRSKFRNEVHQEEVLSVIEGWNTRFNIQIAKKDQRWIDSIHEVLCYFSSDEVKKAMQNRLHSDFYKDRYPLKHNPICFFGWLETIKNDLNRQSSRFCTYDEKADLIYLKGYDDGDFRIRNDIKDEKGQPLWELKNT